jgi:hypothetical protein
MDYIWPSALTGSFMGIVKENLAVTMKLVWIILFQIILFLILSGCTSLSANPEVTVTSLDLGDIPQEQVGNFDVYTESFLIENPTNLTFENVGVDIKLQPTSTFCHGTANSFDYPELYPREKKIEQISIAEFGSLGCQYNYSYQVFSTKK